MTLEEAMEKVRKLLNLTESDNPNEAAAAAVQAQRILDRYEITKAMVEEHGEEEPDDEDIVVFNDSPIYEATKFNLDKWHTRLASTISDNNMCGIILQTMNHKKQIIIVGRPSDVEKVRYIFDWMVTEIGILCKRDGKGKGRTWRNNYRHGVVDTIKIKIGKERMELVKELTAGATTSTALVKINDALQTMANRLMEVKKLIDTITHKTDSGSRMTWQAEARIRGRKAGEEISVNSKARGALKS